jgi:hypothetical protein
MERDEKDQTSNGQPDAIAPAVGYTPTLDQMRAIVEALRHMRDVCNDWRHNVDLPAFPQHFVTHQATAATFRVERALNPRRLPWGSAQRTRINVRVWSYRERRSLIWARRLVNVILERNPRLVHHHRERVAIPG